MIYKKLYFDLDHTLTHCEKSKDWIKDEIEPDFEIDVLGEYRLAFNRPYLKEILEYAFANYEVYICSAGSRPYVEAYVKALGVENKLAGIIARDQLTEKYVNGPGGREKDYIKVISDAIIIDDKDYVFEGENNLLFKVSPYFYNNKNDREFLDILNKLKERNQQ